MTQADKRTKLIKEIMKRKEYYEGILLKDLYKTIKAHPQFEENFGQANINNPIQWQSSTRALLQHRSENMKNFKHKHKDFYYLGESIYSYYNSPVAKLARVDDKKIIKELDDTKNMNLSTEERTAIVKVRLNQSSYRKKLIREFNHVSPFKKIDNDKYLIASHILDYAKCKNEFDAANPNNGLLLSPDIDKLFDLKEITFDPNTGSLIYVNNDFQNYKKMGLKENFKLNKKYLTSDRVKYLELRNKNI